RLVDLRLLRPEGALHDAAIGGCDPACQGALARQHVTAPRPPGGDDRELPARLRPHRDGGADANAGELRVANFDGLRATAEDATAGNLERALGAWRWLGRGG